MPAFTLFIIHDLLMLFAMGMMELVLPIYLFETFGSVRAVFLWQVCWNVGILVLFVPVFSLAMRLKRPMLFMAFGLFVYAVAMRMVSMIAEGDANLVFACALLHGVSAAFYWPIRHWLISKIVDFRAIGHQISLLTVLRIGLGCVAPVLAGVISVREGVTDLFMVGTVILLLSTVPLFFCRIKPEAWSYRLSEIPGLLRKPVLRRIAPAYFFEGLGASLVGIPWLLTLVLFCGDIEKVGYFVGGSALISAILVRLVGKHFDRGRRQELLTRLTFFRTAAITFFAIAYFLPTTWFILAVQTLNQFAGTTHGTCVESYLFGFSAKLHPTEFHFNREVYLCAGRIVGSSLFVIFFPESNLALLWAAPAIGAFAFLGFLTLKRNDALLNPDTPKAQEQPVSA